MRVLALCDYYDPASIGGAERVAREVYTRLVRDHDVDLTVVGAVPGRRARSGPAAADHDGVRVVQVAGRDLSPLLGAQLMVGPGLRRAAERAIATARPDVVHVNGLHFHSSAVGVGSARRHHLPLVATAHLADVSAMPGRAQAASTAFDRLAGGRVVRASDRVLAVSQAVADHVVALGARPDHVSLAANGVDHATFHPAPVPEPRPAQLRVVLVGRLIANKGPLVALEAVAIARGRGHDIRLTVVGDGPLEEAVRRRSREADLAGAVEVVGRSSDVAGWLRRSDVALRTSFTEGLPLAVLEALATGTPVVCTDVPGNVEAVEGGAGLVVPVDDAGAVASALIRLHQDRSELDRLSQAALVRAAAFTWEASAAAHLDGFRAATDGASSPAGR